MRTAAILPVKRFTRAKQRLGATVADPLRRDLARAMVGDVLCALRECVAIERTIVVTGEPSVAAAAAYQGSLVVDDAAEEGQSPAVALGIERALAEGYERALCIPGDCPALDPDEVARLLQAPAATVPASDTVGMGAHPPARPPVHPPAGPHSHPPPRSAAPPAEVVIVPDRHGAGTNGLLLTPPDAIAPSFGPDSCARHHQLAAAAGAVCRVERVPSLLLDIDTGEDLIALRERLAAGVSGRVGGRVGGLPSRARRTRTVLGAWLQPPRAA